jgi:hypothetical protein
MADSHLALKLCHLFLIEDFSHETFTSDSIESAIIIYGNDTAALLTSMLKRMQAIVSKACCIFNTIYTYYSTLMVKLVISE